MEYPQLFIPYSCHVPLLTFGPGSSPLICGVGGVEATCVITMMSLGLRKMTSDL